MEEDVDVTYYSIEDNIIGYTSQELPQDAVEISFDLYNHKLNEITAIPEPE